MGHDGRLAAELADLEPRLLWRYFAELSRVPRASKKEAAAMAWIESVAAAHKREVRRDSAGNRVIRLPATPGCEQAPALVLQSHVDMVCEKDPASIHDFDRDPIQPHVAGGWVTARGTTLGADDGIGVAAALSIGGLKGGHWGVDVDKNRGNAIKLLGRLLLAGIEAQEAGGAGGAAGASGVRIGNAQGGS